MQVLVTGLVTITEVGAFGLSFNELEYVFFIPTIMVLRYRFT